jgi:F-type H+-transporting ATPase subunit delta
LSAESAALNYAEALFQLGESSGRTQRFGDLLDAVAHGIAAAPKVQAVLMSPKVTKAQKSALMAAALPDAPREFVAFLQAVIRRGRQALFGEMVRQYQKLIDVKLDRVRAAVTVARPVDEGLRRQIAESLTRVMGKEVLPHFHEDPEILGGVIVRVGDRVFDGSVRRRMTLLRRHLLSR